MLRCESQTCITFLELASPVLDNVNWHNENALLASFRIAELNAADDLILGALRRSTKIGICPELRGFCPTETKFPGGSIRSSQSVSYPQLEWTILTHLDLRCSIAMQWSSRDRFAKYCI